MMPHTPVSKPKQGQHGPGTITEICELQGSSVSVFVAMAFPVVICFDSRDVVGFLLSFLEAFGAFAMKRILALLSCGVLLFCLAGCPDKNKPDPSKVWNVAPQSLLDAYLDGNPKWSGLKVRVYLPAQSYELKEKNIVWTQKRPDGPPAIVFETRNPPADNLKPLWVEGVCIGQTLDDHLRPNGIRWHISVIDCSVTDR